MIRFLHTADWQIGMKARHVAGAGPKVRAVRFDTIRRLLELASQREVDFIIVAGDIFEDNQVDTGLVHKLLSILEQSLVPIYLLPGNHDPLTPDSVYLRPSFSNNLPPNVTILKTCEPVNPLPGVVLLPAPCYEKKSTVDPTSAWPSVASSMIKIGLAHGSLMIEGRHQPDDFPIPLTAAQRQGLDYLALGHWHSMFALGQRTYYSGTPEPTGFDEPKSGNVLLVSIAGPGQVPEVEPVSVKSLDWQRWEYELGAEVENLVARLKQEVNNLERPDQTLVRLSLTGHITAADADMLEEIYHWLRLRLFYLDLNTDRLSMQPLTAKLHNLARGQPYLRALVADLEVTAAILGQPLLDTSEESTAYQGPGEEVLNSIIEEGCQPDDVKEAVRFLAGLLEEV